MARTIKEIYDEIITEKNTFSYLSSLQPNVDSYQTFLQDLTSSSKVAVWRLFIYICALAIWIHEKLYDEFKSEVETRALELIPGTLRWYVDQTKLFQYGDSLEWDGEKYIYSVIDADKKIITQAVAEDINGQVIVKIAKTNSVSGLLEPLTNAEKTSYATYLEQFKFAGTNTDIINDPADKLKLAVTVYYDPLVLDSSGVLISDGVTKPVEEAITDYIQSIPFNADFYIMSLNDAVQSSVGVVNSIVKQASATAGVGALPYTNIMRITSQKYSTNAGYLTMATGHDYTDVFPSAYDTGLTYYAGEWVSYGGNYYQCKEDGITGAWDVAKWTALTTDEVTTIRYIAG